MEKKYNSFLELGSFIKYLFKITWLTRGIQVAIFSTIIILSIIFSFVENIGLGESLYFAFITALTVGYGDILPHTSLGQFISVLLGYTGIIFFGIIVAVANISVKKAVAPFLDKET